MKEIALAVDKRMLLEKHPSAKILEVDVQQLARKTNRWITRASMSLTSETIKTMLEMVER